MKQYFGGLITVNEKEFETYMSQLTPDKAMVLIEQGLLFSAKTGAFSLEESSMLYQSITLMKNLLHDLQPKTTEKSALK